MGGRRIGTVLATILLLVAVGGGIFLRLYNIGQYGFWTDELFHVFAARSYLANGSLHVPWEMEEYVRAKPVTFLTILSFKLFGESESAARLPFALANIAFILIAYRIIQRLFSRNIAIIFAAAMSLSIFAIQMSQECRMYTLFQLFYFLMSIAFLYGIEPGMATAAARRWGRSPAPPFVRSGVSFKYLAWALGFGIVAASLQDLTFNFIFVGVAYWITMLVYLAARSGIRSAIRSKYGVLLISVAALGALFSLTRLPIVAGVLEVAREAPGWNRSPQSNFSFYQRVLTESHPVTWAIFPLGAFVAVYRYGRKGLFFVLSFLLLFLMHCFAFGRISERYIFQLLPFFLAIGAIGVDFLLSSIAALASRPSFPRWQKTFFYGALGMSLLVIVAPRVKRSVLDTSVPKFANWKDLDPAMVESVRQGVSVTTERLGFNYYFGKYPSYVIDASDVDHWGGDVVIVTLAELERVLARYPDLHLVTYAQHLNHDAFVGQEVRAYILSEMERVDKGPDAHIMVFRKPALDGRR